MFATTKKLRATRQARNQAFGSRPRLHRNRLALDLCGPYVFDEVDTRNVRCSLRSNHTKVAVNLPANAVRQQRVPGERSVVREFIMEFKPCLTDRQLQSAAMLSAEMNDFDRY